eukprot:TRINITY_DN1253_c0_g1_i3.p1 TRINITY_DN1253_c0_g1~~TRINITY_DN1253_c0_g1_i3.p1  ORF type:complete len:176 (+),score=35.07 TRINITY_DN1253_c0_g1_i3:1641-2168(+)
MDNIKRSKSNWYFFRQRNKRRKEVHKRLEQQLLEMWRDVNHYRIQLNSLSHSFSLALSHNAAHQNTFYSLNHQLSIAYLRIQNFQSIIQNLKAQVQTFKNRDWKFFCKNIPLQHPSTPNIPAAPNIPTTPNILEKDYPALERTWSGHLKRSSDDEELDLFGDLSMDDVFFPDAKD